MKRPVAMQKMMFVVLWGYLHTMYTSEGVGNTIG